MLLVYLGHEREWRGLMMLFFFFFSQATSHGTVCLWRYDGEEKAQLVRRRYEQAGSVGMRFGGRAWCGIGLGKAWSEKEKARSEPLTETLLLGFCSCCLDPPLLRCQLCHS